LSKIDIALALIMAVGIFFGYRKGFLMELFYLLALLLGVLLGFRLMGAAMEYLQREFNADQAVLPYLAFFSVFVMVVVAVIMLGKTISTLVDQTFLGRVDAVAGAVLGGIKYLFCASVLLWLAASVQLQPPSSWTAGSHLYPIAVNFADQTADAIGTVVPYVKDAFERANPNGAR
jgi:membrane protein required for colicin V production